MNKRPTLDDLQREYAQFIGPREPPRVPKMQRRWTEKDDIYVETLVTAHLVVTALKAQQPIDYSRLPDKIVAIIEDRPIGSDRPVVDGRITVGPMPSQTSGVARIGWRL